MTSIQNMSSYVVQKFDPTQTMRAKNPDLDLNSISFEAPFDISKTIFDGLKYLMQMNESKV